MSDQQQHPENTVGHLFQNVIYIPIMINSCQLFLYGLYIPIFRSAITALKKRSQSPESRFHIVSLYLLFILVTVNVPFTLACDILSSKLFLLEWESFEVTKRDLNPVIGLKVIGENVLTNLLQITRICQYVILTSVFFIADSVMVFRFFVIWGYRRIYMAVPIVIFALIDVLGGSTAIITELFLYVKPSEVKTLAIITNTAMSVNGFLNLMLTLLIAARIWLETHRNADLMRNKWPTRGINTIIAILLESGIIYAVTLVASVITWAFPSNGTQVDLGGVMIQVAGIAPTLIVARANANRRRNQIFTNSNEVNTGDADVVTPDEVLAPAQTTHFISLSNFSK
ncbi:hypothetical protein L218DRAFT_991208 [Marasmius fiardii PR-910]|nr:hypothetical protein L218DRAFT_991208 [Marasmius fiardii PR-910]